MKIRAVMISFLMLVVFGCAPAINAPGTVLLVPNGELPTLEPTAAPTATATSIAPTLWIAPSAPDTLREAALSSGLPLVASPEAASTLLEISQYPTGTVSPNSQLPNPHSTWLYTLVAPFPTVSDGFSFDELKQAWAGQAPSVFAAKSPLGEKPLLMAQNTYEALKTLFNGEAASGAVRILPAEELTEALWQDRPQWGIVPFEALDPKLKVLTIDGQSPIHKDFNLAAYPLKISFILHPSSFILSPSNYDPSKLTTVLMTGTSALVRAIAFKMEANGITYPGRDLRGWLREADVLHVSNEVSFADTCPPPVYDTHDLRFCSRPDYIGLFEDVGVDVVEATGNHVNNWDVKPFADTLKMYKARGWLYFGGGLNANDAQKPALLEHNGTKLAFIGCNVAGPVVAFATATLPGAAPCGDYGWILSAIRSLREQGYIVIATQQYNEYYQPGPTENQARDFARLAEAGATIVSGSQAHYPQSMTFLGGAFVHYGLGNLFFDQMSYQLPDSGEFTYRTRDEFLDRHVFYNGRYISTELLSAKLEDHSRPRPMTPEERIEFLTTYFKASGW
jgi:poly-gamma-glutamate synthesis protein (capsule biosynthesis protein)